MLNTKTKPLWPLTCFNTIDVIEINNNTFHYSFVVKTINYVKKVKIKTLNVRWSCPLWCYYFWWPSAYKHEAFFDVFADGVI